MAVEEQTPVDEQEEAVLAKKGQEVLEKLYSSAFNGMPGSSHLGVWGVVLAWGRGLPDD